MADSLIQAGDPTFEVKDCALAAIATGRRAQNLKELRDELLTIESASIYHHFWGALLQPTFDDPLYNNDFARWVHATLHNQGLAERLGVIDPTDFHDLEELRRELVDVIEQELDSTEFLSWTSSDEAFHFLRSQIVVFDTGQKLTNPSRLPEVLETMSSGSVFYHFVDARRRTPDGIDDVRTWLQDLDRERYAAVCGLCANVDPFFKSLHELRDELVTVFKTIDEVT